MMVLDSDIGNAVLAGWDDRDDSLRGSLPLVELRPMLNYAPTLSYATTYTDEVAHRLGIDAGHIDLISVPLSQGSSYGLSVGGVRRGHPLLNLQWQLGP
jgi:hypothetical protein